MVFLQETHIASDDDVHLWSYEWGGGFFASIGTQMSCGTIILTSPRLLKDIGKVDYDHEGRVVCIHYKLPEGSVILCNIYAPNLPSTIKDFFSVLPSFVPGNSPCILGGDFNCVPDISIDSVGIAELDLFSRQRDMLDVWRVLHQRGSSFTWHKPDGTDASRLDRFYAPITFTCLRCDIVPCPLSDHDAVKAYFQLPGDLAIGKGLWKLNTDILKEEEFRRDFLLRYEGWQSLKPAFLTLTDWWEDIKSRVKDFAVKYCVVRARRRREEFLALCSRVRAGSSVALHALQGYLDKKLHGARVRARVQTVEADERPTIKFYRDVTKYAIERRIKAVRDSCGIVQRDPRIVLGVYRLFYEGLYTAVDTDRGLQELMLQHIDRSPPPERDDLLASPLTIGELWIAVSGMKNGKSPGSDGLPREFYQTFWSVLGPDLREVFDAAFQNGMLSPSQSTGVITLLPKSGDPLDPGNKRPITLLNVDYKILAKTMCNRLATVMPDLVGPLQTCAVRGHSIQQNLWLLRDLI